jgi:flavin reductase (DIM6/NTAB) family NADH-FMN oxidoreductase RutF
MSDPGNEFAALMSQLDYAMLIVTAADTREQSGCLVGFTSQVSIDPPRFLVCLSVKNQTHRVAQNTDTLIVHLVGVEDEPLARLFGGETGDEVDKFAQVSWREGPGGAPVLTDLENWFAGQTLARVPLGDHVGYLLAPVEAHAGQRQAPITFQQVKSIDPGHPA